MRIEMLPAAYGDCILISYGSNPVRHVLVDAGTTPTWSKSLRPHLEKHNIECLELFVLTHIDADHIAGAIPMLEDKTLPMDIREVWFNGWDHLPKRFLSIKQGERFSELIKERAIPWNVRFNGHAVCVPEDTLPTHELEGGLRLTLLSPTPGKLGRLARVWKKEINRHLLGLEAGKTRRPRFLARNPTKSTNVPKLAATKFRSDTSIPNGSSIALLAEYDNTSVLLAGDAHASILTRSIASILRDRKVERLKIDALKVSHHGSRGNTNIRLLQMLDCKRYLISCNGDVHNLPDNEAIGRIIYHGGNRPHLLFNYRCHRTSFWDNDVLRRRYRFFTRYGKQGLLELKL
ncbi:MAG: MBL fold metallo-hydrolase [Candidatus Thiodiazotropha endolucinida]